ncbi:MAG: GTP-binding protein [Alphaproteobacteria bacterium]|jgi:G3E family GTPase|nr:GTP-binding protein [Alphaproteobacteria bacterium]MDP6255904.1 GTP-binding protein [Alphaproteobacteria bacterium]MDP7056094.1 GTP-binding protein [Alphaproteobacteria bacterium]MDP7230794.1 GTP-binding protein [Alphaproteobacteria bacterium]MDP7462351.1 GTP-binding protein [Alphaproteobacteria bacterium]|tara:strand:- start:2887 stop:3942 length:1056 start_codon:yes stop_codon:yes gene_type:complete
MTKVEVDSLPVSVITGFLGSGKTTLLNRLIQHPGMAKTAVVINEFGEIGIDNMLVESVDDDVVLMSSGCLCCTIRGELVDTLKSLFTRRAKQEIPDFERLVIETTGLADPAPILHTLMADPFLMGRYRLDGVISTADAMLAANTMEKHAEAIKQAAVADRIVITKSDLADDGAIEALEGLLSGLNPAAHIHRAAHGEIDPALLFNAGLYDPETKSLDVQRWLSAEAYEEPDGHGHDHGHEHDVNRHDDQIQAYCVYLDERLPWDQIASWLELLTTYRGDDILRIKGMLNVAESETPIVVHGVQHMFHPPVQLDEWPDDDHRSRIVFITRGLDREVVENMLIALTQKEGSAV